MRGQDLQAELVRAFRAVEDPTSHGYADLDAVFAALDTLGARVGELPEPRRAQAAFFVAVRRCEVRLRQRRLEDAARLGLRARQRARLEGVWKGSYRALLLVLLEQCVDEDALGALLVEEAGYLESDAPEVDAPWLALPLELLRAEVALRGGRDDDGMRRLSQLADRALRELPREDPWRVKALGRLAWELVVRGDLDRAELYLKELPPESARYPRGLVALRRGDFDLALRAGRALTRTGRRVQGLQLQGEALEGSARHAEARDVYARLLEEAREPVDRAIALRSLADCERALAGAGTDGTASLETAEDLYLRALDAVGGGRHAAAESVQILTALGQTVEALDRPEQARELFRASLDQVDAARRELAVDAFGASFLAERHLHAIDGLLRSWDAQRQDVADALAVLEVGKARTLLDWSVAPPRAPGAVARAVRDLALSADPAALDARMSALEAARRGAGSERLVGATTLSADEIRAMLAAEPDTVLVSYWLGQARLWVAVGRGGAGEVLDLGPADAARDAFAAACSAVWDPGSDPTAALSACAAVFLPPEVVRRLDGADRVVLCPDDRLGRVPFEALPVAGEPLGLRQEVERAPSLTLRAVLRVRAVDGPGGTAIVLSEVEAPEDEARLGLDRLRFSSRERELVVSAYGQGVVALTGSRATLEQLERALAEAGPVDLVHISSHAVEDRRVPTASLLLLADGPVALPSLCAVDLRHALVVLSACSSATGEARGGEGDLGLLGWPIAAGARGAVASLWPVNQQATADLMGQFHAFRAAGHGDAEALRRARGVLAAAPQYAHPYYWAGFAVFAPGTVRPRSSRLVWLGLGAIGVLGVGAWLALRRRR